jgi:hypothetical protein
MITHVLKFEGVGALSLTKSIDRMNDGSFTKR